MEKYDDLQEILLPAIDKFVLDFIKTNIESNEDKTNFLLLVYINLLGNAIIQSSKPEVLAGNFEAIKKALSFSFDHLLNQIEDEGKEDLH